MTLSSSPFGASCQRWEGEQDACYEPCSRIQSEAGLTQPKECSLHCYPRITSFTEPSKIAWAQRLAPSEEEWKCGKSTSMHSSSLHQGVLVKSSRSAPLVPYGGGTVAAHQVVPGCEGQPVLQADLESDLDLVEAVLLVQVANSSAALPLAALESDRKNSSSTTIRVHVHTGDGIRDTISNGE